MTFYVGGNSLPIGNRSKDLGLLQFNTIVVAIATGVQLLHCDIAAVCFDCVSDNKNDLYDLEKKENKEKKKRIYYFQVLSLYRQRSQMVDCNSQRAKGSNRPTRHEAEARSLDITDLGEHNCRYQVLRFYWYDKIDV